MYRVTIRQSWDGPETMIHSPHVNALKIDNEDIGFDVAATPSMTFNIYYGNPGYEAMQNLVTLVRVHDTINNMDVFEGRVLNSSDPLESSGMTYKTITCEGLLNWLHDSRPGFIEFDGKTRKQILTSLIDAHNNQMTTLGAPYKCFKLGNIDMADNVAAYCYTDQEATTYDNIETLVKQAGYELAVRHESDGLYLDCAKTIGGTGEQVIRLGSNLISFTRTIDPTALASAYLPLGKAADPPTDDTTTTKGTARLTIASVNNGDPLLSDANLIKQFGPIVGAKAFDDETDATKLKASGSSDFKAMPVANVSTQVQAIDMTFVGKAKGPLLCGWTYRTLIPFKGIDDQLRITQMHIHINDVRTNTMTIGDRVVGQEAYSVEMLKSIRGVASIKTAVQQQGVRIGKISGAAATAEATANDAKTAADDLKKDFDNYDFAGMADDLQKLQSKINALPENIGDMGGEISAAQTAINNDIKPAISTMQGQIKALNDKVGITSAEGSD